jgi:hypothetical protein
MLETSGFLSAISRMGCYHNHRNAYQNSFKPSPECNAYQTLEIKLIKIKPMLMTKYVRSIYGMSDSCVAGM